MMNRLEYLREEMKKLDIILNDRQETQFLDFYELLIERNKVMNLTGITEYNEVVVKHFVDSAAIMKAVHIDEIKSLIDVGTGAGFPGIPLKILYPDLEVLLLDSLKKRVGFLDDVVEKLDLKGIETIHGRAEEAARNKDYRESFDLSVSRAVANLSSLTEYCMGFVKTGGYFVSYKSGKVDEEVQEAKKAIFLMGGSLQDVYKFELPGTDMERSFVVVKKDKKTPKRYPRKAGTPGKEPLK